MQMKFYIVQLNRTTLAADGGNYKYKYYNNEQDDAGG